MMARFQAIPEHRLCILKDPELLRIPRMMADPNYALLFNEIQKFEHFPGKAKHSFMQHNIVSQLCELMETAKMLAGEVRADFLKKAYNWYSQAIGKGTAFPTNTVMNWQTNEAPVKSSSAPKTCLAKSPNIRPQSSINRLTGNAVPKLSRPFTAANCRRLLRPDSCKQTLASTKVTGSANNAPSECNLFEEGEALTEFEAGTRNLEMQEEMLDYSLHHRTRHPDVQAPCDALKRFNLPNTFKPSSFIQDLLPKMEQTLKGQMYEAQKSEGLIKDDELIVDDDDEAGSEGEDSEPEPELGSEQPNHNPNRPKAKLYDEILPLPHKLSKVPAEVKVRDAMENKATSL